MPIVAMAAEEVTTASPEPGAPIPKDQIDPELVKLGRTRLRIGAVTAAGIVVLAVFFLLKLNPDRRFASEPDEPRRVTVADITAGKVGEDSHVIVDAEPMMAHAIRSGTQKGSVGMRVVPARGSGDKLWLVLHGDGWADPSTRGYAGRIRPLEDLPMVDSINAFLASQPRPVFAPADAVRAAVTSNQITTVTGDTIKVRDTDRVGYDLTDANTATVICAFNERHPNAVTCGKALADAGVTSSAAPQEGREQARFKVTAPDAVAATRTSLEKAQLWGMSVEPVTQHQETTWGQLKTTPLPAGLDLVGVYVTRSLPDGAVALIGGEVPQDYWYVLPVLILVALLGLLFAWAFVRAVKRDFLAPRT